MAILKIAQLGHPVLRQRARAVTPAELSESSTQQLIDDLIETMRDAAGAGLAAPQVHQPLRICVVEIDGNPRYPQLPELPLMVLINPVVEPEVSGQSPLPENETISMYEGCLSVKGLRGKVRRPRKVFVRAANRRGEALSLSFEGLHACVLQHEVDHLDGTLFVDRADPKTLCFLPEYERYVPPRERVIDGGGGAS